MGRWSRAAISENANSIFSNSQFAAEETFRLYIDYTYM